MDKLYFNNWRKEEFLGSGSFGSVYRIVREDFGRKYYAAMKLIDIPQNKTETQGLYAEGMSVQDVTDYYTSVVEEIVAEFELMSRLKGHSNIVSYEDHIVLPQADGIGWTIQIRMELLTPLVKHIELNGLKVKDVIQLGIDICKALELCEKQNIIHRDIKPENIFVSENGDFKLGDFGVARTLEKTVSNLSKKGTYAYMAPEMYKGQLCTKSVDIYSLGLVMYRYLNNNRFPFLPNYPEKIKFSDREKAMSLRFSGEDIPLPQNGGKKLGEAILKACSYRVEERYHSPSEFRKVLETIYDEIGIEELALAAETKKNVSSDSGVFEEEHTVNIFSERIPNEKSSTENSCYEIFTDNLIVDTFNDEEIPRVHEISFGEERTETKEEFVDEPVLTTDLQNSDSCKAQVDEVKTEKKNKKIIPLFIILFILIALSVVLFNGSGMDMFGTKVPDFIGKSEETAIEYFEKNNYKYSIMRFFTEEYGEEIIFKQSPESGTEIEDEIEFVIYVSNGKKIEKVMEDFIGTEQNEAIDILESMGIQYELKSSYNSKYDKGNICKQSPAKGSVIKPEEVVSVWVSKGKKPEPEIKYVTVPQVTMYSKSEAISMLNNAGLKYSVNTVSKGYPAGIVTGQGTAAGKSVAVGTVIKIYVDSGE